MKVKRSRTTGSAPTTNVVAVDVHYWPSIHHLFRRQCTNIVNCCLSLQFENLILTNTVGMEVHQLAPNRRPFKIV
ncbi:hypothetical protein GOP47_0021974 [Adiantum capillus-veneris]|uniref:Uncharacterized protein n=1 Tax=Adiantum capillus-veneris TaxID=13818 RepID=A0A9D4Z7F1_ADICA|nr:hypothetical protein GOP47_0021974 [Adiantum capillus-veneris]